MTQIDSDSEIIFEAEKAYVHHWPLDAPKWPSNVQEKIDTDLNKNKNKKKIRIKNNQVKIDNYVFEKLKKIGVTIPFFKKETTMIFEGNFDRIFAHVHITTRSPEYLQIFNHLMIWKDNPFIESWLFTQERIFRCLIDTFLDNNFHIFRLSSNVLMECKKGYVHNFAWFEIQSKKMCINCGIEEKS